MSNLASILTSRYGVTVENAPKITIIWAAEFLMAQEGAEIAKKQLSAVNRKRERLGRIPAYVDYGHPLF